MGTHFQYSNYNRVAHFRIFWVKQFFIFKVSKRTRMFVQQMKNKVVKCCSFNVNHGPSHKNRKLPI